MEPVLNELSLAAPDDDAPFEDRMLEVVAVVRRLVALGAGRVLRTTRGALDEPLANEGSLRKWLARRDQNREARQFLLSVMTKGPYVEDSLARLEETRGVLLETTWNGKEAPGLGAACLHEGVSVSLGGHACFAGESIALRVLCVRDDGASTDDERSVASFVSAAQVEQRKGWLTETLLATVESGAELWRRRAELFPELDFCARVEKDFEDLTGNEPQFPEICRHLAVLSELARGWTAGEFDPPLDWSHESKATLNDGKYGPMRDFSCTDGEVRRFSCHSKLKSQNVRIFFFPDGSRRRVWIGYVGKKIPTVEYPT